MRRLGYQLLLSVLVACSFGNKLPEPEQLRDGDIIFQTSKSSQSLAIQKATRSEWSHMGVLVKRKGSWHVLEAVQPVKLTPLDNWVQRGEGFRYAIKRLKGADSLLMPVVLDSMKAIGNGFLGKGYDAKFEWSDHKMYCSELVYKIYLRGAGISLGSLQKLQDFDLSDPTVKALMAKRYKGNIPLQEPVISPQAIYEAENLETIY